MKILHAFWLPDSGDSFRQIGSLRVWAETLERDPLPSDAEQTPLHPFHLSAGAWPKLLTDLGIADLAAELKVSGPPRTLQLPSSTDGPLPSPQLAAALPLAPQPMRPTLKAWRVDTLALPHPIRQLADLHFLAQYQEQDLQPGSDFLFWHWFTQQLKGLLLRDQYVPALLYHRPPTPKRRRKPPPDEVFGAWDWASDAYERLIADAGGLFRRARRAGRIAAPLCGGAARSHRARDTPARRLRP